MKRYALEIYLPGSSGYDVACLIESDAPFLPIQRGDLINPRAFSSHYCDQIQGAVTSEFGILLKVTGVEHFVFERDGDFKQHKLGIFTTAVDDVADSRRAST